MVESWRLKLPRRSLVVSIDGTDLSKSLKVVM